MSRRQSVEAGFAFWREEVASLQPLRLYDLGPGAFYSHYPETAEYVRMHA